MLRNGTYVGLRKTSSDDWNVAQVEHSKKDHIHLYIINGAYNIDLFADGTVHVHRHGNIDVHHGWKIGYIGSFKGCRGYNDMIELCRNLNWFEKNIKIHFNRIVYSGGSVATHVFKFKTACKKAIKTFKHEYRSQDSKSTQASSGSGYFDDMDDDIPF